MGTPAPALSPEMALLLAACHVGQGPPAEPDGPDDTARLLGLAAYHRVSGLVYEQRGRLPLPDAAVEGLRTATLATLHRNLQNAAELKIALSALSSAPVPAILLKGAHLMDAVYGNPARRPLSDIDILIRPSDLPAALSALGDAGYSCHARKAAFGLAADREVRLTKSGVHEVALDLHTDLNRPTRHHWFPMDALWERSEPYAFEGQQARALCPVDNLTFLCAHAVPHAFAQLIWLCDVAWLVSTATIDPDALVRAARASHTVRATGAALNLAASCLGAPAAGEVFEAWDGEMRGRALMRLMDPARLFGATGYSSRESLRFRTALSDTRADAASVLAASLRRKAGEVARGLSRRKARG